MSEPFSHGLIGHAAIQRLLTASRAHPAPAYVFYGQPHLGKRTFAEFFAQALLHAESREHLRSHPDFILLEPEEGKKQVSVEQVRDAKERLSMKPMIAPRVVALIPSADRMNESGTNALLKVLEEPPADAVFLLVADDVGRLPATVLSRSVAFSFDIVPHKELVDGLIASGMEKNEADARADVAHGRPGLAIEPQEGGADGVAFVTAFLHAKMLGARLTAIDQLTTACESIEDTNGAWRDALLFAMREAGKHLETASIESMLLGIGIVTAMRFIGGAISPRVPLEAAAVRLAGASREELVNLMPTHLPRPIPLLYDELVAGES